MKTARGDHALLDYLIANCGVKHDAEIANRLKMAPGHVSRVRYGHRPVTSEIRMRIMRCFNMPWQLVDELCPPEDFTE